MRIPRRPEPARAPAPWALLSFLLRYPSPEVAEARDEFAAEVAALPDGPAHAALKRFRAAWTGDQTALAARYVETFDLRRRASLDMTVGTTSSRERRTTTALDLGVVALTVHPAARR